MSYTPYKNKRNLIKIDNTVEGYRYIGIAPNGANDTDSVWKIIRETFDGSGNVSVSQTYHDMAKWNERTTLEF